MRSLSILHLPAATQNSGTRPRRAVSNPTLVVKQGQTFIDDIVKRGDARLKYIPPSEQEWWSPQKNFLFRYRTPEYIVYKKRLFQKKRC